MVDRGHVADNIRNIKTLDPNSRWVLQDIKESGLQAIANGQLYRIRREAERSKSTSNARNSTELNAQGMRVEDLVDEVLRNNGQLTNTNRHVLEPCSNS